jgi:hypothetical protein
LHTEFGSESAVIGSNLTLSNLGSTTAGATDHLRVTLTLPSGAGGRSGRSDVADGSSCSLAWAAQVQQGMRV